MQGLPSCFPVRQVGNFSHNDTQLLHLQRSSFHKCTEWLQKLNKSKVPESKQSIHVRGKIISFTEMTSTLSLIIFSHNPLLCI